MASARLTSKGQITLPASVRRSLGVSSGDMVEFIETAPGRFEMLISNGSVMDLKGIVGPVDEPLTIDAMNEVIARSASDG